MKRIIVILVLTLLVAFSAGAESILTIDVGYMMTTINAQLDDLSEHSLNLNASMFIGEDTLKAFFNLSAGYIMSATYSDGLSIDLTNSDTIAVFDLMGGIGGRFFISDGILLLVGVGVHLYTSTISGFFGDIEYTAAGVGGIVNLCILVDQGLGVNLGVKAAYDPFTLASTSFLGEVNNIIVIMPYVGMSMKM